MAPFQDAFLNDILHTIISNDVNDIYLGNDNTYNFINYQ